VWLLQRKDTKVGSGLAKTTGWIRRTLLKKRGVTMLAGVEYERIDDQGLHVRVGGKAQLLPVDTIVVCAGQEPRRELVAGLEAAGVKPVLIGGADVAGELDAKRAIEQGTEVALALQQRAAALPRSNGMKSADPRIRALSSGGQRSAVTRASRGRRCRYSAGPPPGRRRWGGWRSPALGALRSCASRRRPAGTASSRWSR
jgi:hypothetical protein